jgi:hypothetical protein
LSVGHVSWGSRIVPRNGRGGQSDTVEPSAPHGPAPARSIKETFPDTAGTRFLDSRPTPRLGSMASAVASGYTNSNRICWAAAGGISVAGPQATVLVHRESERHQEPPLVDCSVIAESVDFGWFQVVRGSLACGPSTGIRTAVRGARVANGLACVPGPTSSPPEAT